MENNVPQEKWLYPDRCMKKWLGWILSDHSAYMEKASISERPVEPKPEQSQETISDILEDAWQNAKIVAVQIGTPYDDRCYQILRRRHWSLGRSGLFTTQERRHPISQCS